MRRSCVINNGVTVGVIQMKGLNTHSPKSKSPFWTMFGLLNINFFSQTISSSSLPLPFRRSAPECSIFHLRFHGLLPLHFFPFFNSARNVPLKVDESHFTARTNLLFAKTARLSAISDLHYLQSTATAPPAALSAPTC